MSDEEEKVLFGAGAENASVTEVNKKDVEMAGVEAPSDDTRPLAGYVQPSLSESPEAKNDSATVARKLGVQPVRASSPKGASGQKTSVDSQLLNRSLKMKEEFEWHVPHCDFVKERLVLYGEGSATIESVDVPKKIDYDKM